MTFSPPAPRAAGQLRMYANKDMGTRHGDALPNAAFKNTEKRLKTKRFSGKAPPDVV